MVDLLGRLSRSDLHLAGRSQRTQRSDAPMAARADGPASRTHARAAPDEIARLVEARKSGALIDDLAAAFGMHRSTVMSHLRNAGLVRRNAWTDAQLLRAVTMYEAGSSLTEVATTLGCGASTAGRRLAAAGVALRPRGFQ